MTASPKSLTEICAGSRSGGTISRIRPSSASTAADLIPSGVTTRRDKNALRLMLRAGTTYGGAAQQKGTATYFNPQGSVAAGNPSVADYVGGCQGKSRNWHSHPSSAKGLR